MTPSSLELISENNLEAAHKPEIQLSPYDLLPCQTQEDNNLVAEDNVWKATDFSEKIYTL